MAPLELEIYDTWGKYFKWEYLVKQKPDLFPFKWKECIEIFEKAFNRNDLEKHYQYQIRLVKILWQQLYELNKENEMLQKGNQALIKDGLKEQNLLQRIQELNEKNEILQIENRYLKNKYKPKSKEANNGTS